MSIFATKSKEKDTGNKNAPDKKLSKNQAAAQKKGLHTVQETIPYVRVYEDDSQGGIIELEDGVFSKSYLIPDTNYSDAGEIRQEEILTDFEHILKLMQPGMSYQITINNRNVDQQEFNAKVLLSYKNNDDDVLRAQHNELVLQKIQEGKNNLKSEKYLTICVNCETFDEARSKFVAAERGLSIKFKKINQKGIQALSLKQRMEILHDIYNIGQEGNFDKTFDLESISKRGIKTKDVIGPNGFDFTPNNYMKIGNKFARALYLKSIPTVLTTQLMEKLSSISSNVLVSAFYDIQQQDKAVSFASAQVTNIGGEVIKAQKGLSKVGASPDLISTKLSTAQMNSKKMLTELTSGDQQLFHVTVVAVVFADTEDDLELYTERVKTQAKESICVMDDLLFQQEQGLNSAIPLGANYLNVARVMITNDAAAIQPFSTQEIQVKNGFYYGLNQLSKNLIVYNRNAAANQNGVILGSPGKGKSFAAKMEMYQAYLSSKNAQLFIIDPEREYVGLAQALNGTVFSIAPGGETHINPLDLDITKDDEGNAFAEKVDFVISIVESMLGGKGQLNGYLKSIIDNTLQTLYAPYIERLNKKGITIDTDASPTLKDFYEALRARREPEAKNLAASIQMYCVGSLDLFAHKTNLNVNSRFVIYDTKNIGENLKELGMQICLNDIWNRMITNKKKNIRTWFYVDEFYLLLHQPSAARYLQMVWKRARKWMGSPTGVTQNVSDLLNTEEGNTILKTSDFALLLGQSFEDKIALANIYNISEEQQEYITNSAPGEGLIYTSNSIVPFENHVPASSPIYKLLSTKAGDAEVVS